MSPNNHNQIFIKAFYSLFLLGMLFIWNPAKAAILDWQKGFSIIPQSSTDLASTTFQDSLRQLKDTGANYVTIIIPYAQNTIYETGMNPSANTPTDSSLVDGINYAHSLGLAVNLKPHLDNKDTTWRADINPNDRTTWFDNYRQMLNHYALLAQISHVEMITIGTEIIHMASSSLNPTNTQNWKELIANTRTIYSGKLTYSANWDSNGWRDEVDNIGFWPDLDYIGISAYYHIGTTGNDTLGDLRTSWDNIAKSRIFPLYQKFGKDIIFTEVGYRSVDGALTHPASWTMTGPVDLQEQDNGYQSLFDYWKDYSYIKGVQFWDWKSNSNAGGINNSDFTPQGKLALQTITNWFTSNNNPLTTNPTGTSTEFLSDMNWNSAVNGWGPVEKNSSNGESASGDGRIITLNGTTYNKGLGVHAASKINYTISDCTRFISDIGVDDEIITKGSVIFQVFSGVTKLYDSGILWFNSPTKMVDIDVTGVTNLNLVVTDGGNGVAKDHADWADSKLICNLPAETSSQATQPTPAPPITPTHEVTPSPALNPFQNAIIDVWWPQEGSTLNGSAPYKALLQGYNLSQYQMYWQVDGDVYNPMSDNFVDWPHKESWVDVSGWWWKGTGPYTVTFTAKDMNETILGQKSVHIYIAH